MISEVRAIRGSGGGQGDARNSGGSYRDTWYSDWGRRYAWDSWGSDGANRDAWDYKDYKDYKGDNRDTWDSDGDHGSVASAPAAGWASEFGLVGIGRLVAPWGWSLLLNLLLSRNFV